MRLHFLSNPEFIRGQDVCHYTQQHHENGHGHDDDVVTDARKEEKNKQSCQTKLDFLEISRDLTLILYPLLLSSRFIV